MIYVILYVQHNITYVQFIKIDIKQLRKIKHKLDVKSISK